MFNIRSISRLIVGLVFIFSGFVKGVDPLGTAYRIEDYFIAYGMDWANPLSLFLSIFLCTLEFTLGIALLLNLRLKILSWPLLLMMIFFTILTFFDAIYNPVSDCGCFGDALKLTNWETFYKNIVLIIFVGIIFFYRKKFQSRFSPRIDHLAIIIVFIGFAFFSIYQYRHLPMIDFLGWKTGTDLIPDNPGITKTYLTYRNKNTGEEKEYLSPDYPWNDSVWTAQWEFVEQRVDDSGVIKGPSLRIFDFVGNDLTAIYIHHPGYLFIVASYSLETASRKGFEKINKLYEDISPEGHTLIILTGSFHEEIDSFRLGLNPDLEFYLADDIELKMMIRANPGLLLIKHGVVLGKWNWRDIPDYKDLKKDFPGM